MVEASPASNCRVAAHNDTSEDTQSTSQAEAAAQEQLPPRLQLKPNILVANLVESQPSFLHDSTSVFVPPDAAATTEAFTLARATGARPQTKRTHSTGCRIVGIILECSNQASTRITSEVPLKLKSLYRSLMEQQTHPCRTMSPSRQVLSDAANQQKYDGIADKEKPSTNRNTTKRAKQPSTFMPQTQALGHMQRARTVIRSCTAAALDR